MAAESRIVSVSRARALLLAVGTVFVVVGLLTPVSTAVATPPSCCRIYAAVLAPSTYDLGARAQLVTAIRSSMAVVSPELYGSVQGLEGKPSSLKSAGVAAKACSFAGTTVVLMADGTKKPIEDIEVGDKVIATDPESGEQVATTVEHVFVHDDTVVDLVVDGEVITTTEDHPFWSVTDERFERADELDDGELVLSADGRVMTASGLEISTGREALAYNLTVEGIHTYHVGEGEILVHNVCPIDPGDIHGIDRKLLRGIDDAEVWDNGQMLVQDDGQIVRYLVRDNGTVDVVIRRGGSESNTTVMNITESSLQKRIDEGRWFSPSD